MQWRKEYAMEKSLFSNWCWENWTSTCKKMKLKYSHSIHTHTHTHTHTHNSEWIKDLNIRQDTIKLLQENTGIALFDINHSRSLLIHLLK